MAKQYTLGKEERLKSRKLIDQVFTEGKKFSLTSFRIHYLVSEDPGAATGTLKFAAGVSTKLFKKAVDRNRVRRLIKESWRVQKNTLREKIKPGKQLAVFLVYNGRVIEDYQTISAVVKKIVQKLEILVSEST